MRAFLLAAGLGSRLRPITNTIPKCLVPIHGRPLLDIWLEMLTTAGVTSILVNLHYFHEQVAKYIQGSPYKDYVTMVYEDQLLGTAGTLLHNKDFFKDERILLIHADNLSAFDMKAFIKRHECRPDVCEMTMMTFKTPTPQSCGIVELDSQGIVIDFHEKVADPPGNLANGAVFILENSVLKRMRDMAPSCSDFCKDVVPCFTGKIYTFYNNEYHRDIGTPESYELALKEFKI